MSVKRLNAAHFGVIMCHCCVWDWAESEARFPNLSRKMHFVHVVMPFLSCL